MVTMMQQGSQPDVDSLRAALAAAGCGLADTLDGGDPVRRWNGALTPRPLLIARCGSTEQVAAAVRAVRGAGASMCVHNGGQDWTGRSLRDGSVVLDLSALTSMAVDEERQEAVIGGGITAGLLNDAVGRHGLVAVIGNDGLTGVAGLLLGGGYGPLMNVFGLACDNLLSAEVILADGSLVHCDADNEADLFWALRGGGGNFGIVTSARIRLHRLEAVVVGTLVFPLRDARSVLLAFAELMHRATADLFGAAVLTAGPDGAPVLVVTLIWMGDAATGEAVVSKFAAKGAAITVKTEPMPAKALLSLTDGKLAQGRGYDVGTRWFTALSVETIDALIAAFQARTSPLTSVIVHHCHGAATAVDADATAFGMREPHFTMLIYATWEDTSAESGDHRAWTTQLVASLGPMAAEGGYANQLADTAAEQIARAYGANAGRLAALKRRYDPDGLLRAIPLPQVTA